MEKGLKYKKKIFYVFFTALCFFSPINQANDKPNIVLILIDDLGLTDLQAYGGEISTPNIDILASEGMLFTNYHTTPECAPSRAMLLTGMDNHNTGIPMIPEVMPTKYRNTPGYEGYLRDDALTLAEILKPAGYRTYMTGKWHLAFGGKETAALPYNRGFDKTFILDATGGNNFSHHSYLPYYLESPWFKNGEEAELPEDFYSSKFFVDQMIEFIEEDKNQDTPFFSYLSFQAQHIPLQAPQEFIDNMDEWNTNQHTKSGLVDSLRVTNMTIEEAQKLTLEFLSLHAEKGRSPLCGNSISHDRRFLRRYMPEVDAFFHYRNVDVSSIKELIKRWNPELLDGFRKSGGHRAMEDVLESIEAVSYTHLRAHET